MPQTINVREQEYIAARLRDKTLTPVKFAKYFKHELRAIAQTSFECAIQRAKNARALSNKRANHTDLLLEKLLNFDFEHDASWLEHWVERDVACQLRTQTHQRHALHGQDIVKEAQKRARDADGDASVAAKKLRPEGEEFVEETEAVATPSRIPPVAPNNAGQIVNQSRLAVAEEDQPLSLLFLGIIDFDRRDPLLDVTDAEWAEMKRDFYKNVKLTRVDEGLQQTVANVVEQIDTVIQQADVGRAIDEIEKLSYRSPRVNSIRRSIQQYAANVKRLGTRDVMSEYAFDNATNGHLVKTLIDPEEDRWRLEEGELQGIGSKIARTHRTAATDAVLAGQKLDLRLTLKDTDAQLEALICLRSGGLPKATTSKIEGDRADLINCLMETLWSYMSKVQGVPSKMLVDQFILGLHSYDWESHLYAMSWRAQGVFCCGSLKRYTLPRTLAEPVLIEDAVFTLLCVEATLSDLVVKLRNTSKIKARLFARQRRVSALDDQAPYARNRVKDIAQKAKADKSKRKGKKSKGNGNTANAAVLLSKKRSRNL
ncbi:hypothetical protein HDU86_001547 [Geranomyces michiganensis]|nr:hypothetical protein HDU86_001547 [Geranomyces michiganensis]